jgi:hypothetical protein
MEEARLKITVMLNIMNFISVVSLFVIMVRLINDALNSFIADTTVSASVE